MELRWILIVSGYLMNYIFNKLQGVPMSLSNIVKAAVEANLVRFRLESVV